MKWTIVIALCVCGLAAAVWGQTDTQPAGKDLKRGLVLYFSFDKPDPTGRVSDQSGEGNDGRLLGAQWTPSGKRGGGCEFGAVTNSIHVPNNKSLNVQQVTMAAWIRTTRIDRFWRRVFDKGWNTGYTMGISGSDPEGKSAKGQGQAYSMICKHYCSSEATIADGQWHHIVATFDGGEQRLYVDGRLARKPTLWEGKISSNNYDLTIGLDGSTPDAYTGHGTASFSGTMDEVMLYNRALSEKEVLMLFATQQ